MLQPPSHMSKVCGHGHIKKFWLMQTQKENQTCDSKSNSAFVAFPHSPDANGASFRSFGVSSALPRLATSCSYDQACQNKGNAFVSPPSSLSDGNRGSLSGLDPHCPTSCGYACSEAGTGKHSPISAEPSSPGSSSGFWKEEGAFQRIPNEDTEDMECLSDASAFNRSSPSYLSSGVASDPDSGPDPSKSTKHKPLSPDCHIQSHSVYGLEPPSSGLNSETKVSVDEHIECYRRINGTNNSRGSTKEEQSNGNAPELGSAAFRVGDDKALAKKSVNSALGNTSSGQEGIQPVLKTCTLCGTTKTPMWRSGPQGPKSLCNACGIRFKKYRALPGATESLDGTVPSKCHARPSKRKQQNGASDSHAQEAAIRPSSDDSRQQKKSKWHQLMMKRNQADVLKDNSSAWRVTSGPASLKKIYGCMQSRLKDLGPIGEHLTVNRVFAKDEEDAAKLLMHLSCGIAC